MTKWLEKQKEREQEAARKLAEDAIALAQSRMQEAEEEESKSQFKPAEFKAGDAYVWQAEDSVYDIARRMNIDVKQFMAYNELEDPNELEAGVTVYCPANSVKEPRIVTYEPLPEPLPMHIAKAGGAKKWTFGNVVTWDDFESHGFFPERTNVLIVAIAHVPVEERDGKETEAAYYMDAHAFGEYHEVGRVTYTIGYSWSDLEAGHVEKIAEPEPVAEKKIAKVMDVAPSKISDMTISQIEEQIKERAAENPETYPNFYKSTYQGLVPPVPCVSTETVMVQEHDGRRPDRQLAKYQEITIAGTFEKDGVLYGRPIKSSQNDFWFGIPMDFLIPESEMYNVELDVTTRAESGGNLTWQERLITIPLSKLIARRARYLRTLKTKIKD